MKEGGWDGDKDTEGFKDTDLHRGGKGEATGAAASATTAEDDGGDRRWIVVIDAALSSELAH